MTPKEKWDKPAYRVVRESAYTAEGPIHDTFHGDEGVWFRKPPNFPYDLSEVMRRNRDDDGLIVSVNGRPHLLGDIWYVQVLDEDGIDFDIPIDYLTYVPETPGPCPLCACGKLGRKHEKSVPSSQFARQNLPCRYLEGHDGPCEPERRVKTRREVDRVFGIGETHYRAADRRSGSDRRKGGEG